MMAMGFGCAVRDPPFESGCADVDFRAIWLEATLYVLATLYAALGVVWVVAKGIGLLRS
jgi:hypothetical protein